MSGYSNHKNSEEEWEAKKKEQLAKNSDFVYNISDKFKNKTKEQIIKELRETEFPAGVLMVNFEGDFNIGGVFRSGNCFNFSNMYYFGKKKRDKRGEVGVFNYSSIEFIDSFDKVIALKNKYKFVALENNIDRNPKNIVDYVWEPNSLIIVGSESNGISKDFLDLCDDFIQIPMFGTCRSYNAATAASIAMFDYVSKKTREKEA